MYSTFPPIPLDMFSDSKGLLVRFNFIGKLEQGDAI